MRLHIVCAFALVLGVGCHETTRFADPDLPDGSVPLNPVPSIYAVWWKETERCSGVTGDPSAIRWFQLPGAHYFYLDGVAYDGTWWETRWILIAGGDLNDGALVRHEMLHDLLRQTGHPAEYFKVKCAGVVSPPSK
jgi:hypothetical protein